MIILSRSQVRTLITMERAIEVLREAHAEHAAGHALMPPRVVLLDPPHQGWIGLMPAYLPSSGALGLKSVTVYGGNPAAGLPSVLGSLLLLDPTTGASLAVMEASYLTGVRTAAASGLATRLLAREEASELAILGAGTQGRFHLAAMAAVRPIRTVRVHDRNPEDARRYCQELQPTVSATLVPVGSAEEAVRGADLVVTTSTSPTPIVEYAWLKPGAHVNGVGSHTPAVRELAGEVIARGRVVVDSREAALQEAGDLLIPMGEGLVPRDRRWDELGEVVLGTVPGRSSPEEITVYKSVGVAIQDMAVARLIYQKALEAGIGTQVEMMD